MILAQVLLILQSLFSAIFPVALITAAISDFRHLEITNRVCVVLALAFLPAAVTAGLPVSAIAIHYLAGLVLFSLGAVLFRFNLFGGGDVKLLAACGIWFAYSDLGLLIVLVALYGGLLAVFILVVRRSSYLSDVLGRLAWLEGSDGMKQAIPYGVAIAAAALTLSSRLPVLPPFITDLVTR